MKREAYETRILTKLMFRLLPVQILLAAVGSVNGIVSSFFAALFLEEMAGNVVEHGFTKDTKQHTIGIRMVYRMAKKVEYQNILGLNVLTIRI